jgi:hypothetical protein
VATGDGSHCERCGADMLTGKKAPRTYKPMVRRWEAGLPFERRLRLFLAVEAGVISIGLLGAWLAGSLFAFLVPWLVLTAMVTVLLGSYDRLDLSRDERGRVLLTKSWRICFLEREPVRIPLVGHESVVVGQAHDVDFWDWLGVACLIPFGIVPGLCWWFYAFNQVSFYAALTKDHGYPATILYQGWKEEQAKDIAKVMRDVCEMPGEV